MRGRRMMHIAEIVDLTKQIDFSGYKTMNRLNKNIERLLDK